MYIVARYYDLVYPLSIIEESEMTRISKKAERRARCPKKRKGPSLKTGPLKDNLPEGYKPQGNVYSGKVMAFIPKIK